eukprot:scaffold405289_cov27-Prasinocladus_malaysianus.AAC.1
MAPPAGGGVRACAELVEGPHFLVRQQVCALPRLWAALSEGSAGRRGDRWLAGDKGMTMPYRTASC